jgi:hypothetical protein
MAMEKTLRPFNPDVLAACASSEIQAPLGVGALVWRYTVLVPVEESVLGAEARTVADLDDIETLRALLCDHFGGVTVLMPLIGYGLREAGRPETLELNRSLPFVVCARPIAPADRYFEHLQAELQEALIQGLILVERQDAFLLGSYTSAAVRALTSGPTATLPGKSATSNLIPPPSP